MTLNAYVWRPCVVLLLLCLSWKGIIAIFGFYADVSLTFVPDGPQYLNVGQENVKLTCRSKNIPSDKQYLFFFKHVYTMRRRFNETVGGQIKETNKEFRLATAPTGLNIHVEFDPEFYDSRKEAPDYYFTFKKVRDVDDGLVVCGLGKSLEIVDKEASIDIVVLHKLELVELTLDGKETATNEQTLSSPIETDVGKHNVTCVAQGSNPAATEVNIFMDEKPLVVDKRTELVLSSPPRRYRVTSGAELDIDVTMSGHKLSCVAKSMAGDIITVAMPIKVVATIKCKDTEAHVGQMSPILICTVDHMGVTIERYGFKLGIAGETLYPGEPNADGDKVKTTKISDSETQVELHLHKAKNDHFTTIFYLVVEQGGGYVSEK